MSDILGYITLYYTVFDLNVIMSPYVHAILFRTRRTRGWDAWTKPKS